MHVWVSIRIESIRKSIAIVSLRGFNTHNVIISDLTISAAQFHRVTVVETKQVARDQEMRELRETIVSLQKEVKRHDSVVTSQQQEGQPSELSAGKLHQRVVELERENARLQLKLAESERTKQG